MRAGALTERLRLLRPVRQTDRMGAESVTWKEEQTVWAELARHTGRRSEEAGEHFPDHSAEFNIRLALPAGENWRVLHLNEGLLYTVVSIVPNRAKDYKTLRCERVNE